MGHTTFALPGVGSYIAVAIAEKNLKAIGWAILTMLIVIMLYDQLLFRPLVAWVDRFRVEQEPGTRVPQWSLARSPPITSLRLVVESIRVLIPTAPPVFW